MGSSASKEPAQPPAWMNDNTAPVVREESTAGHYTVTYAGKTGITLTSEVFRPAIQRFCIALKLRNSSFVETPAFAILG